MLAFSLVGASCAKKWDSDGEKPIHMEGSPFNMYFNVLQSKIVNDCNPFTNGEYPLYDILQPFLKVVVDVGARDDTYFIEKSNTDTEIYLFEPHPEFYKTLMKNIQAKNLETSHKKLQVLNMGLSDKQGTLQYHERAESFVNRWGEIPSKELPVIRLDSMSSLHEASEISFIKIDTEGFELDVLRGAAGILYKTKLIQFEYGGTYPHRGILLKDVLEFLQKHRFYYFYYIYGGGLLSLDTTTVLEHQQYSNILACKFSL